MHIIGRWMAKFYDILPGFLQLPTTGSLIQLFPRVGFRDEIPSRPFKTFINRDGRPNETTVTVLLLFSGIVIVAAFVAILVVGENDYLGIPSTREFHEVPTFGLPVTSHSRLRPAWEVARTMTWPTLHTACNAA